MSGDTTAALVTGAAQGIGRAIAERLADEGRYDLVACIDIQDTAASLQGGRAYVGDVSDHDRMQEIVDDIETDASITTAINNAGFSRYFWIGDLEPEEWDEVVDVNLKGQYNIARAVGPRMYERSPVRS